MKKILGVVAVLVLMTGAALGQAGFGSLSGVVTDKAKAAVPGAVVTLTSPEGVVLHTTTNKAGEYSFSALVVGPGYTLTVVAPNFSEAKIEGIQTTVGDTHVQNVTLLAGAADTVVEVTGAAEEQVQTDTSSVSQVISNKIWEDAPLSVRDQNEFVGLTAGAASGAAGRGYAVDGARSGTGNFLVEGADNNDQGLGGGATGGGVVEISPDAIEEYRVISHNPSAEYGRAGGFSTDTSLKSGTSHWHGSLFEYNRIQALAAQNFFSKRQGILDSLIRNQFGGSIGGPIYKDKTFFYATFEDQRQVQGSPATGEVTTQAFLNFVNTGAFETFQESNPGGLCVQYTGTTCPGKFNDSATLGKDFKQLLAAEPNAFPLGTQNPSYDGQGLYTYGVVTYPVPEFATVSVIEKDTYYQEKASFKLDHKLGNKDQIASAYLLDFQNSTYPRSAGGTTFGPDETSVGGAQLFTLSETHTFSPTFQNVARIGYTRHVNNIAAVNAAGVPMIVTADDPLAAGFGAYSGIPQLFTENEFTYEDNVTKVKGRETLKAGFRYVRTRNGSSFYNDANGTLYPWDTESLVTDETFDDQADRVVFGGPAYGSLYEASASIDTTTNQLPDVYRGYRANEYAAYFQDDFKVTHRLMLNAGLRWEYFGPPHNFQAGFDSNVFFGPATIPASNGNPFYPLTAFAGEIVGATFQVVPNSVHKTLWNRDTNNFAPRLGFSYDVFGNGKLAIRGGFGMGYDRLYNNVYENIRFNSPRFSDNTIGTIPNGVVAGGLEQPALLNLPFNANSLFAAYGGKPVPRHVNQNLITAYYEQTNLGFEYQVARGLVVEANYIGTWGRKLVGLEDINNYDGRNACNPITSTAARLALCAAAGYPNGFTSGRITTLFNSDNFRTNGFNSNYNALQLSARQSFNNGLQFLLNYTWSKNLDEISDVFTTKTGQTGITDPQNPAYDYGPTDNDVRNLGSLQINYELPFKKDSLIFGGFGISTITSMQSGTEFTVTDSASTYDPNEDGREVDRAVYVGGGSIKNAINHNVSAADGYLKAGSFAPYTCPVTVHFGLWCDPPTSRNNITGPAYYNTNLAVFKRFTYMKKTLTIRAAFFDAANTPSFGNPVADINNPAFGQSQGASNRETQLSANFNF
jgi:hypothetical protein